MSDPAKSNDIEDVLSSIRRLVAENAKAAQDRDALVLTQDHRVSKPLTNPSRVSPVPSSAAAPQALRTEPVLTRRAESVTPKPAPELPRVARSEPAAPAAAPTIGQMPTAGAVSDIPPAPPEPVAQIPEATTKIETSAPMPAAETAPQALNAGAAEPVFRTVSPPEPATLTQTPLDAPVQSTTLGTIPPAPPMTDAGAEPEGFEDALVEMAETAALEKAITGMEAAISQSDQDWEPDDVFPTENDPAPLATSTTGAIDQGMLRDLVVETVREELRGDLGEKITRNVRKLVRREIQRALTAQTLD